MAGFGLLANHAERPQRGRWPNVGFLSFYARTGLTADGPDRDIQFVGAKH
jgi:hypothetical protein